MKSAKIVLLLALLVALAAVVIQNQEAWRIRFLWMSGEMPGIILLLLTTAAGFVAGIIVALVVKGRT